LSIVRVSTQHVWQSTLRSVNNAGVNQSRARDLIVTGRRISRASDDPAAADRSTKLRASVQAIEQYERAGQDAVAFMNAQDRTLQTVLDRMSRVQELTIAMATDTMTSQGRDAAASEVGEIRAQMLTVMNESHGGKSLFGGFQGTAVTDGPGGVSFSGDAGQVLRRVASDHVVQINIDAQDAFGFSSGTSLFDVLDGIIANAGAADLAALGGDRLDELGAVRRSVMAGLGQVGTRTIGVEDTLDDLATSTVSLQRTMSDLEDVDLVEASIAMSEVSLAYEAALAASAQINRVSLLNYL
jgi:flagellar hook-associated protein 3 FlgL